MPALLLESGDDLLLESGDVLLLEELDVVVGPGAVEAVATYVPGAKQVFVRRAGVAVESGGLVAAAYVPGAQEVFVRALR